MITEQDIDRVTNEQAIYEQTLENQARRNERLIRQLRGRVRDLERTLEQIRMSAIAGLDQ